MNELLKTEQAAFGYAGHCVVEDLCFCVEEGDYLCIVGENGAGKSTLLRGLLGLLSPMAGKVTWSISRREIGYLPQQSELRRDFPASVGEVVLSGRLSRCGMLPFYRKKDKEAAMYAMERMEIADLRHHCYRHLSGGQQQRVLLARALCASSRLLILDEPTAGLDPVMTHRLYTQIAKLNAEDNIAVVTVSHDIRDGLRHAKHVLHLGKYQTFYGTTADYLRSPLGQLYAGGEDSWT